MKNRVERAVLGWSKGCIEIAERLLCWTNTEGVSPNGTRSAKSVCGTSYLDTDSQNYRDAVTNTRLARLSSARLRFREILFAAILAVGGTTSVCLSFNSDHMAS